MHGWGQECLNPKPIIFAWTVTVADRTQKHTYITFDVMEGSSPSVIGLDKAQYSNMKNLCHNPHIMISRPSDNSLRSFVTYITSDYHNDICQRMRVELVQRPQTLISSMLPRTLHSKASRTPKIFAKKVHRYTHAHADTVKDLCKQAGVLTNNLEQAIDDVDNACEICARNGHRLPSKKVSLNHVNEAFNQ